jgi:hypothetical protein
MMWPRLDIRNGRGACGGRRRHGWTSITSEGWMRLDGRRNESGVDGFNEESDSSDDEKKVAGQHRNETRMAVVVLA